MMRTQKKRGQYATEYLLVFAFSVLILLPGMIFLTSNYNGIKYTYDTHQAHKAASKIATTATEVYYAGSGSMTTVLISLPSSTSGSTIKSKEIAFRIMGNNGGYTDIVSVSKINLTGELPNSSGLYRINITSEGDHVSIS